MTIRERLKRLKGRAKEALRLGGSPSRSTSSLSNAPSHPAPNLPQTHFQPSSSPSGAHALPSHVVLASSTPSSAPGLLTIPHVDPSASAPTLIAGVQTPPQPNDTIPNAQVASPEISHFSASSKPNQTQPLAAAPKAQASPISAQPTSTGENTGQPTTLQPASLIASPTARDGVELTNPISKNESQVISSSQGPQATTLANVASPTPDHASTVMSPPTNTASKPASSTWNSFRSFRQAISRVTNSLGPLGSVMAEFGGFVDMYDGEAQARQDYAALKTELESLFDELKAHISRKAPPAMTAGMKNLCTAIENELDRISSKEERNLGRRYLEANRDLDDVMQCYRRIQGHLERLKLNTDLSMWMVVDELASENRLESLKGSMSACYNSKEAFRIGRRECTPKTREQVLGKLDQWRYDKKQDNLYWLNGMAGTGKTTIASSLCAKLDQSHELGASFFCTRLLPECRDVTLILPTIAYQLARFSRPFYSALSSALQADPDLHTKALPIQLRDLIIGPVGKASPSLPENLVVVIDALDECEDSQGVGLLLELLAREARDLPLKIFVSSRPEPPIRVKIGNTGAKLILHELEKSIVADDIKLYLQTELGAPPASISDSDLATLVERAGVLFIYAATVVRYIQEATTNARRQSRIRAVLDATSAGSSKAGEAIDGLYNTILTSVFDSSNLDDDEKSRMRLVLDTVVCAQEPLTVKALAGLLKLKDVELVEDALDSLQSVIHISGSDKVVTTLHASFPDYMLDPSRPKQHGCHSEKHHGRLAEMCFDRIDSNEKQFNICDLESSYVFDEQVPDLDERVEQAIPYDLSYACRYWAVHLELGGRSVERIQRIHKFVAKRLLLWIEVLNLKKQMSVGPLIFEKAKIWCREGNATEETSALVHDAWRFVLMFAANDVSRSTTHLYVSMLASWPNLEPLTRPYIRRVDGLTRMGGTGMARRQLALLSAINAGDSILSVAFSPDGLRIVSGSYDETIRVWDAQTGQQVLDPLEGHTGSVKSVAFSSDGTRIVSGSYDKTIRVWDAQTGRQVLDPLEGHTDSVKSVAFSPDGTRIVSGSDDKTIRVWDAQTGRQVLDPLEGHTGSVKSVAFSSDGTRIVSGSYDKTIRVWDSQTGQQVLDPLEGHTGSVKSVAFSPNGTCIVSGSGDKTIRVWDAQTGRQVIDPLEGHTGSVKSVAFSPDGTRIVSGSDDKTIRVWDAQTGRQVLDPLEGHTGSVKSVAFSSDGTRIVSGSYDKTIRVWDSQTGQQVLDPLEGHTDSVNSVAFSPDGTHIVSGSYDETIRVWDSQTGRQVLDPLEGHTDSVNSVAFSPDGTHIVSGSYDETIRVWDAQTGRQVLDPLEGHTDSVNSVAFSPDGTRIISGSGDKTIRVWDSQTGRQVIDPLEGHTGSVKSVAFSPDGTRIVSGSGDKTIRVWDSQTGRQVLDPLEGPTNSVNSVAFSPDGTRIVSGSGDKTIRVWDSQTGRQVIDPLEGHTGWVNSVAFSPDGTRIVSGSDDETIRVWDARTGRQVLSPLNGHPSSVTSVAFSPDGTRIVSGSYDETIRVWDTETRLPVLNPLEGHTGQATLAASSPDGTRMISDATDSIHRASSMDRSSDEVGLVQTHISVPNTFLPAPPFHISIQQAGLTLQQTHSHHSWVLDPNGWVMNKYGRPLLWLPPDLRDRLVLPNLVLIISTEGSIELDFQSAKLGESWRGCYKPYPCA